MPKRSAPGFVLQAFSVSRAVLWLRWLVAGLSPRRPGLDPGSVHVGFVVDKVASFPPSTLVFPCQFHSTSIPLHGKAKKLIIFITLLHNKPQGCGASVASAAGPFTTKKRVTSLNRPLYSRFYVIPCVVRCLEIA